MQSILDYTVPGAASPPPTGGGNVTPGYSQAGIPRTVGAAVGSPPLAGVHNTPIHIAVWGLAGVGVIVLMHHWGFRLLSVGRYSGGR